MISDTDIEMDEEQSKMMMQQMEAGMREGLGVDALGDTNKNMVTNAFEEDEDDDFVYTYEVEDVDGLKKRRKKKKKKAESLASIYLTDYEKRDKNFDYRVEVVVIDGQKSTKKKKRKKQKSAPSAPPAVAWESNANAGDDSNSDGDERRRKKNRKTKNEKKKTGKKKEEEEEVEEEVRTMVLSWPTPKDRYEGGVRGDPPLPYGEGVLVSASGFTYKGGWKDGARHGKGTFATNNGEEYVGMFVDDVREGHGRFEGTDGTVYTGEFAGDFRDGQGRLTDKDGAVVYEGQWDKIYDQYSCDLCGQVMRAYFDDRYHCAVCVNFDCCSDCYEQAKTMAPGHCFACGKVKAECECGEGVTRHSRSHDMVMYSRCVCDSEVVSVKGILD